MLKFKKFYSVLLAAVMIVTMSSFCVFADDQIAESNMANAIEAQYVGEENGAKVYEVTIPIEWHSYEESDIAPAAASSCKAKIYYLGNGVWEYNLTFTGMDLIKYLNGTLSTYGVAGSTTRTLSKINSAAGPVITVNEELHYLHPTTSGCEYFKVQGTVEGLLGYGSFGPQTDSVYVTV